MINHTDSSVLQTHASVTSLAPQKQQSSTSPNGGKGSLNHVAKKREAARIDRENEKIMKSLLKQAPALPMRKIEQH